MSELLKSGQHPDADQLSAFVEHALPPHEQQQTLAHLAVCSDCRAIVSLALPPVEELPKPQPESARKPWFSGWHLALPVAAAFAALVVIVHIHNATSIKSSATTTQMAVSAPPRSGAPLLSSSPSAPEPPAVAAETEQSSSRSAATAGTLALSKPRSNNRAASAQDIAQLPIEGRNVTDLAQNQPASANGSVQASQQSLLHGSVGGASGAANGSGIALQSIEATNTPVATPSAAGDMLALKETKSIGVEHPLPSHLPAMSIAANANQIMAIDTQSNLFLSEDGGQHWKTISPQWQGRAVKVALASAVVHGQSYAMRGLINSRSGANFGAVGGPVALAAPAAPSQATSSSVTGAVTDPTGAVISDASVVVRNTATRAVRNVKTDGVGHYLVDDLTPGNYQIEVQAPGFTKQQLAVTLTASEPSHANLILPIGQASQTVAVDASAVSLDTESPAEKKIAAPQAASQPLPVFEITTDAGERWTSSDGQIWKHQ
jgi:hypothetical protein